MLFNSIAFLVFFPLVFFLYWFVFKRTVKLQNIFLITAGYVFYGWWDWRFLLLLIFSSITDFYLSKAIVNSANDKTKKQWIVVSLLINMGLLGFFKYFNFFSDSFADLCKLFNITVEQHTLNIILPVGISFYTFQSIGYIIDVYRNKVKPPDSIITYMTFVSFFPQLVAGPIERANNMLPQLIAPRIFDRSQAVKGMQQILLGFFKKVVVADGLALLVKPVFDDPSAFHGSNALLGMIFFSLQIYFDFSGYSDIAIGTARLLGFKLMENFNVPYFSASIKEFWTRWHISLSTWFRDYLFIPLGGSKVSSTKWLLNIFITFLISGFWHGPNYTFIIWGGIHAVFYLTGIATEKMKLDFIPRILKIFFTFLIVTIAWCFFRANTVSDALMLLKNVFIGAGGLPVITDTRSFYFLLCSLLMIFGYDLVKYFDKTTYFNATPLAVRWLVYYCIIGWILLFGVFELSQQFIYFQF